ncbi:hypothetical protein CHLNCDRAFT_133797 [Chlorella variabilis]|uniref:Cation-transporting P-type ATPase N-terminal domain-containing protein n=1 Tax=Chlorella variabilis TaxID=554065 RepID=E1ZF92_CHLVA|nr:hypothetical protein CHLNCDRAFT_133797 [Chlorella variabilis]EFN55631.1 hypothetical protein CHLNCDRAFT_133797 [Chlorella variabilis]|eukprot:XP_005847733.1 hypothetical protein CHLNCDRAFT_133797 [Chlorella variabilis]
MAAKDGDTAVGVGGEADVEVDFKEISEEEALNLLKASKKGLTSEEVAKRLEEYGYNKLPEESRNAFLVYLSYMWNPLSWAMEAAAIIAIALLDYADFALIVALLFVNATISYVEEANADKAIKALTSALAPKAKALRDGQVQTIDASNLVPGDICIIRLGDIVPADIKILGEEGSSGKPEDETPLQCDQAALTGESLPVKKFTGDVAFAGSTIKQGERHCVVYFPTILIVLLAVFNDGAMIALSKDTVTPSRLPNRWNLNSIFLSGIGYGLYLTLSSWALYYVATHTDFFDGDIGMFSLQETQDVLDAWCTDFVPTQGYSLDTPACQIYPDEITDCSITALEQCTAEQKYVRGAMTRALLYLQVSISGQAVVFVVRTISHSFLSRAGTLTYVAFVVAQTASTLIAIFGFNGYEEPRDGVEDCKVAPVYGTEGAFTASVLGCTYYAVVAWIWSLIWHMGLDPLKWIMYYIMDEEGFRAGGMFNNIFRSRGEHMGAAANIGVNKMSMSRVSATRASMSRVSHGGYQTGGVPGVGSRMVPNAAMLQRASLVKVH